MDLLSESLKKTQILLRYPSIRHALTTKVVEKQNRRWYPGEERRPFERLLNQFQKDLRKDGITQEDLAKLHKLHQRLFDGGILLFHPTLPVVPAAYNIATTTTHFNHPGWLFHATDEKGLQRIIKDKKLLSPIESIIRKKRYYSWKAAEDTSTNAEKRLRLGISFALQDTSLYQLYTRGKTGTIATGGFFITPFSKVLDAQHLLSCETVDGFPEVDLIDTKHTYWSPYFLALGILCNELAKMIKDYRHAKKAFETITQETLPTDINRVTPFYRQKTGEPHAKVYDHVIDIISKKQFLPFYFWHAGQTRTLQECQPFYTAYQNQDLTVFSKTLFWRDTNLLLVPNKRMSKDKYAGAYLLSEIRRARALQDDQVVSFAEQLDPKSALAAVKQTMKSAVDTINMLAPLTRTRTPLAYDISESLLFLGPHTPSSLVQSAIKKGIATIQGVNAEQGTVSPQSIRLILRDFFSVSDLPLEKQYKEGKGYFYKEGTSIYFSGQSSPILQVHD